MSQPVVYFEIEGRDGKALQRFYSQLFGWVVDAEHAGGYGIIQRDDEARASAGIDGAVLGVPDTPSATWRGATRAEGYPGSVTVFVEVPELAGVERPPGSDPAGRD